MANDILLNKSTKHIDARHHYLKEKVADGCLALQRISTTEQAADGFTKPLRIDKFNTFLSLIGMD